MESRSCPRAPTRGIRMAGPRGTVATGGVRSPPRHHAHAQWAWPVKQHVQLTSGPHPYFIISRVFNHPNIEIRIGDLPLSKTRQILLVHSLKHEEKLYFLDQLKSPTGLHVINSGTNSNLNLPRILK
jgi:hypothetical protein